ncbi:MAG TPA: 3-hydroxyacyl-ACP dehydratase FabZ [Devosia sp.]|nr:3-hydroxyacyl-ACP dehydratase FabZ [Devosia sp.]
MTESTELTAMSIAEILTSLPHRYPFLMIDKIIKINGDETAVGVKNVTFNEPIFQGHFPGDPIFPGVLIIEGMAQTAGAIVIKHDSNTGKKNIVLMLGVDKARFRKPAGPGDVIEFHIAKIQRRRNVGRYKAEAIVDGTVIAEAEITAMIVEASS